MDQVVPSSAKSVRDTVYHYLLNDILTISFEPGEKVSEKEISKKYQVSRTPVREAFLQLSRDGLLEIYPQKATRVSMIDLDLMEEARFMREQLEIAVVKLACEQFPADKLAELEMNLKLQQLYLGEQNFEKIFQLDEAFHRIIFEGCNKSRIWEMIQRMNIHLNRVRVLRLVSNYDWDEIYQQHQNIYRSICDQDLDQAEDTMRKHMTLVLFDIDQLKQKYPHYFKGKSM